MHIHVLEVRFAIQGNENILYPVILECDQELLLVDCGYPGFTSLLENALMTYGFSLKQLTGVIITHHDIDHLGSLFELKQLLSRLKVYSSRTDEPYISGKLKSLRLEQAEDMYDLLPQDQKEGALYFQATLRNIKPMQVDHTFEDKEELELCSGVQVISTPGHMPGHISLYAKEQKTMIAADAFVFEHGKLAIANPDFTLDLKSAVASIRKLQQFQIEKVICYHGGVVVGNINEKLHQLALEYAHLG